MISGFAQAGFTLNDSSFVARADKAAEFIESYFHAAKDGRFLRTCYVTDGGTVTNLESPIGACVKDYCNVIAPELDLFQATVKVKYLKRAVKVSHLQLQFTV